MRTEVPEKLLAIVDEIDSRGSANLTGLAVLKKWFEHPGRLSAFGLWVAKRAAGRKGKTKGEAGRLLDEARALLGSTATFKDFLRVVDRGLAEQLHDQARDFQNEIQPPQCGVEGSIRCRPLFLVERGVALHLDLAASPADGYKLAADYCQHNDSRHGNSLNGPSRTKIMEIVRFMFNIEAIEDLG